VTESADNVTLADKRRTATAKEISRCAQRLTDERGLDGFTMDELAEQVGVSRRTLFNYVPGKIDAVLGPDVCDGPDPFAAFRAGGPTGELMADMRDAGETVLRSEEKDFENIAVLHRLLRSDARLMKALHERLEGVAELLSEAIVEREGSDFDPYHARVLARLSLCIFDAAIAEFVADESVPVADHYLRVFDAATELFSDNAS
jgi:AcrR family transcriptional regulator